MILEFPLPPQLRQIAGIAIPYGGHGVYCLNEKWIGGHGGPSFDAHPVLRFLEFPPSFGHPESTVHA